MKRDWQEKTKRRENIHRHVLLMESRCSFFLRHQWHFYHHFTFNELIYTRRGEARENLLKNFFDKPNSPSDRGWLTGQAEHVDHSIQLTRTLLSDGQHHSLHYTKEIIFSLSLSLSRRRRRIDQTFIFSCRNFVPIKVSLFPQPREERRKGKKDAASAPSDIGLSIQFLIEWWWNRTTTMDMNNFSLWFALV